MDWEPAINDRVGRQLHMRKSAKSKPNPAPTYNGPRYRPRWLIAVACSLLGLWILVGLIDFRPAQSVQVSTSRMDTNLMGAAGAEFSWWSLHYLGVSTWLIPFFLLWSAIVAVRSARRLVFTRVAAMVLCILAFSGLGAMWQSYGQTQYFTAGLGGIAGTALYERILHDSLGVFGAGSLLISIYICGLIFVLTKDIGKEFEKIGAHFRAWREQRAELSAERSEEKAKIKEAKAKEKAELKAAQKAEKLEAKLAKKSKNQASAKEAELSVSVPATSDDPLSKPKRGRATNPPMESAEVEPAATFTKPPPAKSVPSLRRREPTDVPPPESAEGGKLSLNIVKTEETKKARSTDTALVAEGYQFPHLGLLSDPVPPHADNSEEEHQRNAEDLLRILGEFGVAVTLGEIHVGPVITRYEVAPAPGVRVEKIAGLDKNIALGMRAQSVRILAPIPGKAAVGVEVPNQHPTPVGMREILESEAWATALKKSEIPIALGKDVSGKPIISDLTKMPHLLIAGATGSGKSVCINSIIASILYSKSPKDLRLIMVDPKVVELKVFNPLPHMLIPVVTEPKKVPGALKWLLNEMETRYQIFAKCNVRNIVGFNTRKRDASAEFPTVGGDPTDAQGKLEDLDPAFDEGPPIPDELPYIVAIIDELADLMMVAPAEIETSIARLAQLARAAGIHLIIATQRPSVNVITGVIKANLPSRIAFQVASQVDSRTILDTKGADNLIGRGDMLFSPPGTSRLVRAQGAFASDEEVLGLVEFLKVNGPPRYATSVQEQIDRAADGDDGSSGGSSGGDDLGDDEELYQQALDVLRSTKRASTSMIQRRLRIGYNRAARVMDLLEDKGVVGPENGSSPREILVDLDSM